MARSRCQKRRPRVATFRREPVRFRTTRIARESTSSWSASTPKRGRSCGADNTNVSFRDQLARSAEPWGPFGMADMWLVVKRLPLAIAYIAAVIPALAMALAQPVWSRIDEAPNADFIVQLSHGVYPVADTTLLDPETVRVLDAEGFFTPTYPGATGPPMGPPPDPTETGPIPTGMSDRVNAIWMTRHMWELSRESDQTPVYFALTAPVWWLVDRLGGPFAAIYAIRIIGALLIATVAPMAVSLARVLTPTRPEVSALAALFAILLPGLNLNGTRISND